MRISEVSQLEPLVTSMTTPLVAKSHGSWTERLNLIIPKDYMIWQFPMIAISQQHPWWKDNKRLLCMIKGVLTMIEQQPWGGGLWYLDQPLCSCVCVCLCFVFVFVRPGWKGELWYLERPLSDFPSAAENFSELEENYWATAKDLQNSNKFFIHLYLFFKLCLCFIK